MSVQFDRILYPTDFSDLSLSVLPYAVDFARRFDGALHCLHVVDDGYQYWSALGPESVPAGPPPEAMLDLARKRMERFASEHLSEFSGTLATDVAMGRPFAEIIAYAREHDVHLIIMATHGRGAVAHMLLGSTTEKVVRKAPCAVLTVRSNQTAFVMP